MMRVPGCRIETLDHLLCKRWLDHVVGCATAPADLGDQAWLLYHGDDGVTWGCRDGSGWRLASTFFPELCPVPSEISIQEMRLFSRTAEVLIWRAEGSLRGRVLRDDNSAEADTALRPDDEERLLLSGQVRDERGGFTRIVNGAGAEQVLPVHMREGGRHGQPLLCVRHYFARDDKIGCIRIVATRLLEVK